MRKALILGTGGHCRVVLSMLMARKSHVIGAVVELDTPRVGEVIMGVSVIPLPTMLSDFSAKDDVDVFLAIGNNDLRRRWWDRVKDLGFSTPNLISSYSLIDDHATIGDGNIICARAFIGAQAELGSNNLVNTAAVVDHEVTIQHHCHLAPSSTIGGRTHISDLCMIGAGATIVNGLFIARNTLVGAGATLIRPVKEPNGVYVGVPAKRRDAER